MLYDNKKTCKYILQVTRITVRAKRLRNLKNGNGYDTVLVRFVSCMLRPYIR